MAIQTINIGNRVNDGLGDDLRTAFEKVNANFTELSEQLTITASNIGDTGTGIFKQKTDANLEFKSLVGGRLIALDDAPSSIIINNTAPDAFTRIDTDSGSMLATTHQQITLQGVKNGSSYSGVKDIEVTVLGSSIRLNTRLPVTEILETYDFGPIDGDFSNAVQLGVASSNIDFGTIVYEGTLDLNCGGLL